MPLPESQREQKVLGRSYVGPPPGPDTPARRALVEEARAAARPGQIYDADHRDWYIRKPWVFRGGVTVDAQDSGSHFGRRQLVNAEVRIIDRDGSLRKPSDLGMSRRYDRYWIRMSEGLVGQWVPLHVLEDVLNYLSPKPISLAYRSGPPYARQSITR